MIDSARSATSSAGTAIGAPVKAAGDTVATALGSVIETASERGRKARRKAGKRARSEITHQRRVIHKQAKDANRKSRKVWADFAEETATRATNVVEASKGGRVARHGSTRRVVAVLAVGVAVAVVVVRKTHAAPQPTDNPTSDGDTTPRH